MSKSNKNRLSKKDKRLIKKALVDAFLATGLEGITAETSGKVPDLLIRWFDRVNRA